MIIEKKIADPKNYGDKRNVEDIEYIVIQEVSDKPISHYQVMNNKVIQVIPDDYISNSVNGPKCCHLGIYHGISTKYNSITICIAEIPNNDDLDLLSHLIMTIKRRYKISVDKIIRQSEVTGEPNPQIFLDNDLWRKKVIQRIHEML